MGEASIGDVVEAQSNGNQDKDRKRCVSASCFAVV